MRVTNEAVNEANYILTDHASTGSAQVLGSTNLTYRLSDGLTANQK